MTLKTNLVLKLPREEIRHGREREIIFWAQRPLQLPGWRCRCNPPFRQVLGEVEVVAGGVYDDSDDLCGRERDNSALRPPQHQEGEHRGAHDHVDCVHHHLQV